MKLWNKLTGTRREQQPALKRPRVCAVLRKKRSTTSTKEMELRLARDVLAMNEQLQKQEMPYRVRLRKGSGNQEPEIVLIEAASGLPVSDLAYSKLCELALLPKD